MFSTDPQSLTRTSRSSLHTVRAPTISKSQRDRLAEDLKLELSERARKMRAQYEQQAHTLRRRIEMRINRVPKRLWKVSMGELMAMATGQGAVEAAKARMLVEDVRRLSGEHDQQRDDTRKTSQQTEVARSSLQSAKKSAVPSARERMPPPPLPQPGYMSPTKSREVSREERAPSPVKKVAKTTRRAPAVKSRPGSRATMAEVGESGSETGYASGAGKVRKGSATAKTTGTGTGLKRGGVKGVGNNGSLKENKATGVKETTTTRKATGRVLRSRK